MQVANPERKAYGPKKKQAADFAKRLALSLSVLSPPSARPRSQLPREASRGELQFETLSVPSLPTLLIFLQRDARQTPPRFFVSIAVS